MTRFKLSICRLYSLPLAMLQSPLLPELQVIALLILDFFKQQLEGCNAIEVFLCWPRDLFARTWACWRTQNILIQSMLRCTSVVRNGAPVPLFDVINHFSAYISAFLTEVAPMAVGALYSRSMGSDGGLAVFKSFL